MKYALIKTIPTDLIFGKNEYTTNNNPITKISIENASSKDIPIEIK